MKPLKQIGQVLAAIVYTCIFTGLLYLTLVLPIGWLLSLNTKMMILAVIVLGGIIQGIIFGLQVVLMMPYMWIVKKNIVALVISIGLILFNLIANDVQVWRTATADGGRTGIVLAIIISVLILEALVTSIYGVVEAYMQSKDE